MKKMILSLFLTAAGTAHAAEIDFFTAIDHILERDQNLLAQDAQNRSDLRALDADRKAALPSLNASIIKSVRDDWTSSGLPQQNYWQADLSLNLYRFGQDASRYRLAERGDSRYAAAQLRQIMEAERLAAEKILVYIYYSRDLALLQKIYKVRERLLDVSSKQYNKGLLPQQEVKKVELDLRTIDLQIKRAEVQVGQARVELERYLGLEQVADVWPIAKGQEALKVLNVSQKHPLYSEAEEALAMEKEREKILWAAQYPSLDAQAIANRSISGDPFNRGQSEFLLSLTVPLLDRGLSRSLYSSQIERSASASHNLEWIKQNLEVQNKNAAIALKETVSNIEVYDNLIITAKQIYQDSLGRFERGLLTVNDLAIDESRFYNAERDSVQSWYNLQLSWISSCQSSGVRLKECHSRVNS